MCLCIPLSARLPCRADRCPSVLVTAGCAAENKYSSFQRQLNLYGFRKLVRGNEAGGYMHPLFERGKPEQLSQVRRGFFPEVSTLISLA